MNIQGLKDLLTEADNDIVAKNKKISKQHTKFTSLARIVAGWEGIKEHLNLYTQTFFCQTLILESSRLLSTLSSQHKQSDYVGP